MKKEGSQGADNNSRSQTREPEVQLAGQTYGLGGIVGFLVGIGINEWGLKRARFLLDEIDEDLFLRKTARAPGELCEAYFYSGIKRLLTGDKSGAMDLFDRHPIRDSWFCRGPVSSDSDERVNGEAGWTVGRRMGVSAMKWPNKIAQGFSPGYWPIEEAP